MAVTVGSGRERARRGAATRTGHPKSRRSCPVPAARDIEFLVAAEGDRALACGALQRLDEKTAEIKRMYVIPDARGTGLSRRILRALEDRAREWGCTHVRLETALMFTAAVGLYSSSGFHPIEPYGEYVGDPLSYCMEKPLI